MSEKVFDPHRLHVLAPAALVLFCLFLLFLNLSGSARKMEKKQKETKELFQAAKRQELMHRESDGDEDQTLSERRSAMKVSSQPAPPHNSLAIRTWTWMGFAMSILLLIEDGLMYALPTPWDLLSPFTCFAPLLVLNVLISEVGCFVMLFQKATPGRIKWFTIVALVLGLLSLVLYVGWFPYMEATCRAHPCT